MRTPDSRRTSRHWRRRRREWWSRRASRPQGLLTGRTTEATAAALCQEVTTFPGGHGGKFGGKFGQRGEPEAFAARLREFLGAPVAATTG